MSDSDWLVTWLKSGPRVGDGAMGTMLQRAGLPQGAAPEAWNRERPEAVVAVHAAYREAGAEWLQTNSFGGNRFRLEAMGLGEAVTAVNTAAVRLAREAAGGDGPLVVGSLGPTGRRLEPPGARAAATAVAAMPSLVPQAPCLTPGAVAEAFAEQSAALGAAGADLLLVETMSDVEEAEAAIRGARTGASLPVIATMTFGRDGRTLAGDEPETAGARLVEAGAVGVGANCSFGPAELLQVIERLRAALPGVPLVVQPNAGLPRQVDGQFVYDVEPPTMAAWARRLVEAGADLVGGCCGSTPAHIRGIRAALKRSP